MPKKKNKKDKQDSAASDPVEALRAAIERTFHATTDSAAGTQKRTRQLVDEVTSAAARIRTTIEELRVLDEVKGLRNDIDALARRVGALEGASAKPASRTTTAASRSRSTRTTSRAKASGTSRAQTASGAKSSGTSAAKSTGTTRAKPAAARKPRTTRSSASTRSRSPRASGGSSS